MLIFLPVEHHEFAEQYNLDRFAAELIARAHRLDQLAEELDQATRRNDAREHDLARREADVLAAALELKRRKHHAA